MSGLDNLRTRLQFNGGNAQIKRMNEDKLKTLKKALLYSYQSATAELNDGRLFRCLINPDKIKNQYDNKIISIPFEDICLNDTSEKRKTSEGIQTIGMKPGDVFRWVENGTDWIVYLRRLEETAYFRAEIRRCKYSVDIDGTTYKVYAARNDVNEIDWRNQKDINWNDIDYKIEMYITKDEKTEAFFHRFAIIELDNKPWEVQAVDSISSDGIIIIALKEYYQNTIEKELLKEEKEQSNNEEEIDENEIYIDGESIVYPYDKKIYTIKNTNGGNWIIQGKGCRIITQTENSVNIEVTTGKSGSFKIQYIRENEDIIEKEITIKSL